MTAENTKSKQAKKSANQDWTVRIIGFPMDLGAGRRGVDMGPSALRIAGVGDKLSALGYNVIDAGDITIKNPEVAKVQDPKLRYLHEIVLGGDHSMAIGTIAGIANHCKKHNKRFGVIWIDAHADINTPDSSPSGNIHGMPVAVSLGIGAPELTKVGGEFTTLAPHQISMIGLRSLDPGEVKLIKKLKIEAYTMSDLDKYGVHRIIAKVLSSMRAKVDHLHVSFDLDSVDPSVASGVGTPVPGGLSYREAHLIMEAIADTGYMSSFEIAEVNPILDSKNAGAEFAADLIASSMGKRIL
jgi:arginase